MDLSVCPGSSTVRTIRIASAIRLASSAPLRLGQLQQGVEVPGVLQAAELPIALTVLASALAVPEVERGAVREKDSDGATATGTEQLEPRRVDQGTLQPGLLSPLAP